MHNHHSKCCGSKEFVMNIYLDSFMYYEFLHWKSEAGIPTDDIIYYTLIFYDVYQFRPHATNIK